ncbi:unnamed protein product [Spirodela intermedia]|uniref:Uncharacterized protein n=2 Tax=Spirodela intermedia TaxID=51605 RepID=A0A7I8JMQ9_SPIIN|nr:unnamed protein product [Spirodela intermedia]CAA6671095.1 unnamed protein product [Spirodela intermedia]CAA7408205.1 unnamed protein product [Spirodela intermedia]
MVEFPKNGNKSWRTTTISCYSGELIIFLGVENWKRRWEKPYPVI